MNTKRITDIPGLMHLWQMDNLLLAGQPSPDSFEALKSLGITKIINVRGYGEIDDAAEEAHVKSMGLEYEQFPIVIDGILNAENCERLSSMIDTENPHFIHCGSANRVGGWLITYLVKHRGLEFEAAVEVAMKSGLSNPGFISHAEDILGL